MNKQETNEIKRKKLKNIIIPPVNIPPKVPKFTCMNVHIEMTVVVCSVTNQVVASKLIMFEAKGLAAPYKAEESSKNPKFTLTNTMLHAESKLIIEKIIMLFLMPYFMMP